MNKRSKINKQITKKNNKPKKEKINISKMIKDAKSNCKELGFKELSMGMSSDYDVALKFNSTFIRIGSKIFGERS